jgi:hypothetical protein
MNDLINMSMTEAEKDAFDTNDLIIGEMIFCTDSNKLYIWNNAWLSVTLT